jgi:hypothetical protein
MVKFTGLKENQTVYIKVTGKEAAYYSVQVQLIKDSDREWWRRPHGDRNQSKGYNEIVIFEDIPYEFTIEANEKAVYQLHTKEMRFYLEMSSLLPVELCMTEEIAKPPFAPNCEESSNLTSRQMMDVQMERGKIGNIGVTNNNNKTNKFSIKFYGMDKVPDVVPGEDLPSAKCLPALTGKVAKYIMKSNTSACYSYFLTQMEDTEFIVDVVSDEYGKVNILALVGDIERIEVIGEVHIFKKKELEKACGKALPCVVKVFIDSEISSEIRFTLQPLSGTVLLLDGIANEFSGSVATRHFSYEVLNKLNTTIVLTNKNSGFKFYGSLV